MTRTPDAAAVLLATDPALPFAVIAGKPALRHAAERLLAEVDTLLPVGPAEPVAAALAGLPHLPPAPALPQALDALAIDAPEVVVLHDATRPYVPARTVAALLAALAECDAAVPVLPLGDALTEVQPDGRKGATRRADGLYRLQMPQAFRFAALRRLAPASAADLASAFDAVALVPGSEDNIVLRQGEHPVLLERLLAPPLLPRVGTGFDVHVLEAGRRLMLCGIQVPHSAGLAGHSDADVGIHALCDAIYGALAEGDIGRHFPPSEAAWKDADSARFLVHAAGRIAARGGVLGNADVTLICERPKITPYAAAMMARLAELLQVPQDRISVKATTTERLGFTGRMEGIAAQAVATILLPG